MKSPARIETMIGSSGMLPGALIGVHLEGDETRETHKWRMCLPPRPRIRRGAVRRRRWYSYIIPRGIRRWFRLARRAHRATDTT
jgi:hypothetical protein